MLSSALLFESRILVQPLYNYILRLIYCKDFEFTKMMVVCAYENTSFRIDDFYWIAYPDMADPDSPLPKFSLHRSKRFSEVCKISWVPDINDCHSSYVYGTRTCPFFLQSRDPHACDRNMVKYFPSSGPLP